MAWWTKIPRATRYHLACLATAVLANALNTTYIFAFVGFLVVDVGAASTRDEAGYTAGYVLSAFMAGRLVTSMIWGSIADRWGRKPVLMCGLIVISIGSVLFGFSTSLVWAVSVRFLTGALNPIIAVSKTMVSELCSEGTQSTGMTVVVGMWNTGLIIGPAVGGWLARPAIAYPSTFASGGLFGTFPYLLPSLVVAALSLASIPVVWIALPETLPKDGLTFVKLPGEEEGHTGEEDARPLAVVGEEEVLLEGDDTNEEVGDDPAMDTEEDDEEALLRTPGSDQEDSSASSYSEHESRRPCGWCDRNMVSAIVLYMLWSFSAIVYTELVPLWCLASSNVGGLDFETGAIGSILGAYAFFVLIYQFTVFPVIAASWRPLPFTAVSALFAALLSVLLPLVVGRIADASSVPHPQNWAVWIALVVILSLRSIAVCNGFTNIGVITNNSATVMTRGKVNGAAMMFGSLTKAVGPVVGASVFAWSANSGLPFPLNHHAGFVLAGLTTLFSFVHIVCFVPASLNTKREE